MCVAYMYICVCGHRFINEYIRTYIHIYIYTYIHTYMHTYIHTYMHTYMHTYIHILITRSMCMCIVRMHICVHIYIYRERERITSGVFEAPGYEDLPSEVCLWAVPACLLYGPAVALRLVRQTPSVFESPGSR